MSTLLEINDLHGGYEKDVNILQGVNLTVAEGEAVGIIGLNGSGKSTLGKAVMNMIPYRNGSIVFDGQHIEDKSTHELAHMGFAIMHQGGVVFPNLSVWQNLQLAWGTVVDKDYYQLLKEIVPILQWPEKELKHMMADKLSGGQRHELALAMTMARKPRLVILDEPSAGLSPQAIRELYAQGKVNTDSTLANTSALCPETVSRINGILVELQKRMNLSILLIEQNASMASSFCDRCVMMEQGRVKRDCNLTRMTEIEGVMFDINY